MNTSNRSALQIVKRLLFTGYLFFLTASRLFAGDADLPFYGEYCTLRDAVYNQQRSLGNIGSLYRQALESVENAGGIAARQKNYWLSRIEYMMGRAEQNLDRKKEAASYYDKALDNIDASLQAGEYSEGYRMKSEIISQMCLVKGVGFIIGNGLKVGRLADKALEMDPGNGKAIIIHASAKVYPPPIYGGNPREGIDLMKKAQKMSDIEKDDLFNIYSGLGVGYAKLEQYDLARFWLESSLDLYPENIFANEEYQKVLEKKKPEYGLD